MFARTYKNTLKTLFRTPTFWLMAAVLMGIIIYNNGDMLGSALKSEYLHDFDSYHNLINNIIVAKFMMYPMPLFAAVTAVLILNHDYGDMFYEIEKAYNMKPIRYLFGRILSLVTVNGIFVTTLSFLFVHLNVFFHGGVEGLGMWSYLADSFIRIMRVNLLLCIPSLTAFIAVTYMIGALFKSGFAAMITSSAYVIAFYFVHLTLHMKWQPVYQIYFRYFDLMPRALRLYAAMADTSYFELVMSRHNDTALHAILGFCSLISFTALGILISYLRIKKRTV